MLFAYLLLAASPVIETIEAPLAKDTHGVSKMHVTCKAAAKNDSQIRCMISVAHLQGRGGGECYLTIDEPFERDFDRDGADQWRSGEVC